MPSQPRPRAGCSASRARRARMAKLTPKQIERLIYPVSFYRNKAVHVKETCQQLSDPLRRRRAVDDGGAADAAGRRPQDREPGADPRAPERGEHLRRHARPPDSNRLGWVATRTPEETEHALYAVAERRWWPIINLYLVTWGQNVCRPVYPLCGGCAIADLCPKIGVTKMGKTREQRQWEGWRKGDEGGAVDSERAGLARRP